MRTEPFLISGKNENMAGPYRMAKPQYSFFKINAHNSYTAWWRGVIIFY